MADTPASRHAGESVAADRPAGSEPEASASAEAGAAAAAFLEGQHGPGAGTDAVTGGIDARVEQSAGGDDLELEKEAAERALDADLGRMIAERDEYLDALQHLQADFENYRKLMVRRQDEQRARAAEDLVVKLLPALDTLDLALEHEPGAALEQVRVALWDVLGREGLERLEPIGQPFDPNEQDAVAHEPGDADPEVIEVMRAGYRWKGRVIRPAMVKVKGG